jgi:hypothetical protein
LHSSKALGGLIIGFAADHAFKVVAQTLSAFTHPPDLLGRIPQYQGAVLANLETVHGTGFTEKMSEKTSDRFD